MSAVTLYDKNWQFKLFSVTANCRISFPVPPPLQNMKFLTEVSRLRFRFPFLPRSLQESPFPSSCDPLVFAFRSKSEGFPWIFHRLSDVPFVASFFTSDFHNPLPFFFFPIPFFCSCRLSPLFPFYKSTSLRRTSNKINHVFSRAFTLRQFDRAKLSYSAFFFLSPPAVACMKSLHPSFPLSSSSFFSESRTTLIFPSMRSHSAQKARCKNFGLWGHIFFFHCLSGRERTGSPPLPLSCWEEFIFFLICNLSKFNSVDPGRPPPFFFPNLRLLLLLRSGHCLVFGKDPQIQSPA